MPGIRQQFYLVLKKNLIVRKRQPFLLAVEILWPVLIFVVVMIIRQITLPQDAKTCRYASKALPSSGILPAIQSFICNLEDECLNETDSSFDDGGFGSLEPLIHNRTLRNALMDLPPTLDLLENLQETLKDDVIQDFLSKRITFADLLINASDVEGYAVNVLNALNRSVANTLLHSSLDLTKAARSEIYKRDIREILCDSRNLDDVLLLPENGSATVEQISEELCQLNLTQFGQIGKRLQQQLNTTKVFHTAALLTKLIGDREASDAWIAVGKMMDTMERLKPFDLLKKFAPEQLENATDWLPSILRLLSAAKDPDVDFKFIGTVLYDLEQNLFNGEPSELLQKLRQLSNHVDTLVDYLKNELQPPSDSISLIDVLTNPDALLANLTQATNFASSEWESVLLKKLTDENVEHLYGAKSTGDYRALLCENYNQLNASTIVVSYSNENASKSQGKAPNSLATAICSSHKNTLNVAWPLISRSLDLPELVNKLGNVRQSRRLRSIEFSKLANVAQSLRDEMRPKKEAAGNEKAASLGDDILQSLDYLARNLRMETFIDQASDYFKRANWSSTAKDGMHLLWTSVDSKLQASLLWKNLKSQAYTTFIENKWMNSVLDALNKKKLTFGSTFQEPITTDEMLSRFSSYLPHTIQAELTARPKKKLIQLMEDPTITEQQMKYYYCVEPGFVNLVTFDASIDLAKIYQIQQALCRLDLNTLIGELDRTLQFTSFAKELQAAPKTYKRSNFSIDALYDSGIALNRRLSDVMHQWSDRLSKNGPNWTTLMQLFRKRFRDQPIDSRDHRKPSLSQILLLTFDTNKGTPAIELILDTLRAIDEQLGRYIESVSTNGATGEMIYHQLNYGPYLEELVLRTLADPPKVKALVHVAEWTHAVCGNSFHNYFDAPSLPPPMDWSKYRQFLCNFDYRKVDQQLGLSAKKGNSLAELAEKLRNFDDYYGNSERQSSADSEQILRTMQNIEAKLQHYSQNSDTVWKRLQPYNDQRRSAAADRFLSSVERMQLNDYANLFAIGIRVIDYATRPYLGTKIESRSAHEKTPYASYFRQLPYETKGYASNNNRVDEEEEEESRMPFWSTIRPYLQMMDKFLTEFNKQFQVVIKGQSTLSDAITFGSKAAKSFALPAKFRHLFHDSLNPEEMQEILARPDQITNVLLKIGQNPERCRDINLPEHLEFASRRPNEAYKTLKDVLCDSADAIRLDLQQLKDDGFIDSLAVKRTGKTNLTNLAVQVSKIADNVDHLITAAKTASSVKHKEQPLNAKPQNTLNAYGQPYQDATGRFQLQDVPDVVGFFDNLASVMGRNSKAARIIADLSNGVKSTALLVQAESGMLADVLRKLSDSNGRPVPMADLVGLAESAYLIKTLQSSPDIVELLFHSFIDNAKEVKAKNILNVINPGSTASYLILTELKEFLEMLRKDPKRFREFCSCSHQLLATVPGNPRANPLLMSQTLCGFSHNSAFREIEDRFPEFVAFGDNVAKLANGEQLHPYDANLTETYGSIKRLENEYHRFQSSRSAQNLNRPELLFDDMRFLDSNVWSQMWSRLTKKLTQSSMHEVRSLLTTTGPMTNSYLSNAGLGPYFAGLSYFADEVNNKLKSISPQATSLAELMHDTPQLRRLILTFDRSAVDLVEVGLYSAAERPNEISELLSTTDMNKLQQEVCFNPKRYFSAPVDRQTLDVTRIFNDICSMDPRQISTEMVKFTDVTGSKPQQQIDKEAERLLSDFNRQRIVDVAATAEKLRQLSETVLKIKRLNPNFFQPLQMNYLEEETWRDVGHRYADFVSKTSDGLSNSLLALGPIYDAEINKGQMSPILRPTTAALLTAGNILRTQIATLAGKPDSIVLLAPGSVELKKLAPVMENLGTVVDTLIATAGQPTKVKRIYDLMLAAKDPKQQLCQLQNLQEYLVVLSADDARKLREVQARICNVNADRLSQEIGTRKMSQDLHMITKALRDPGSLSSEDLEQLPLYRTHAFIGIVQDIQQAMGILSGKDASRLGTDKSIRRPTSQAQTGSQPSKSNGNVPNPPAMPESRPEVENKGNGGPVTGQTIRGLPVPELVGNVGSQSAQSGGNNNNPDLALPQTSKGLAASGVRSLIPVVEISPGGSGISLGQRGQPSTSSVKQTLTIFGKTPESWKSTFSQLTSNGEQNPFKWDLKYLGLLSAGVGLQVGQFVEERFPIMRQALHAMDGLIRAVDKKLADVPQGADVSFETLFPNEDYTKEALRVILPLSPKLFEALLWSASSTKASTKIVAAVDYSSRQSLFDQLCHPDVRLSEFLYHPTFLEADWQEIKKALCFVIQNSARLEQELGKDLDVMELKEKIRFNQPFSWRHFTDHISSLNERLTKVRRFAPRNARLGDDSYLNEQVWRDALRKFMRGQTDPAQHLDDLLEQVNVLQDVANSAASPVVREYMQLTQKLFVAVNDIVAAYPGRSMQIQDLLPSGKAPTLRRWMTNTVKMSPAIADALLNSRIRDSRRLEEAVHGKQNVFDQVCNQPEGIEYFLDVPLSVSARQVTDFICESFGKQNLQGAYADLEKLLDMDFAEFSRNVEFGRRGMNRPNYQSSSERPLSDEINKLTNTINQIAKSATSVDLPENVAQDWNRLAKRIVSSMGTRELEKLPEYAKVIAGSIEKVYPKYKFGQWWKSLQPYVAASRSLSEYFSGVLERTYASGGHESIPLTPIVDKAGLTQQIVKEFPVSLEAAQYLVQNADVEGLTYIATAARFELRKIFCDIEAFHDTFPSARLEAKLVLTVRNFCHINHERLRDLLIGKVDIRQYLNKVHDSLSAASKSTTADKSGEEFDIEAYYKAQADLLKNVAKVISQQPSGFESFSEAKAPKTTNQAANEKRPATVAQQIEAAIKKNPEALIESVQKLTTMELQKLSKLNGNVKSTSEANIWQRLEPITSRLTNALTMSFKRQHNTKVRGFVRLSNLLPVSFNISRLLTQLYGDVPLFVEAFTTAQIDADSLLNNGDEFWNSFCRNGTLGAYWRFPTGFTRQWFERSLCKVHFSAIVQELQKQMLIHSATMRNGASRVPLNSSQVLSELDSFIEALIANDSMSNQAASDVNSNALQSKHADQFMLHDAREEPLNDKDYSHRSSRQRFVSSLKSISVVIAGSGTWQKIVIYGKAIMGLAGLVKGDHKLDNSITAPVEWSLYDESDFSQRLQRTYNVSQLLASEFMNSNMNLSLVLEHGTRTLCDGYAVSRLALKLATDYIRHELQELICRRHYPEIVDELHKHVDLRKIFVQSIPDLARMANVDWEVVDKNLEFIAKHEKQVSTIWPEHDAKKLLEIDTDISSMVRDWQRHQSKREDPKQLLNTQSKAKQALLNILPEDVLSSREFNKTSETLNKIAEAMNVVLEATNKRLRSLETGTVKLGDLVKDPREARQVLASTFGLSQSVLDVLLTADVNLPELRTVLNSRNPKSLVCSKPIESIFRFSNKHSSSEIADAQSALCNSDTKQLLDKLYDLLDSRQLVNQVNQIWQRPKSEFSHANWKNLFRNTEQLSNLMSNLVNNPQPKLDEDLRHLVDFSQFTKNFQYHQNTAGHSLLRRLFRLGMKLPDVIVVEVAEAVPIWSQMKEQLYMLDSSLQSVSSALRSFADQGLSLKDVATNDFLLDDFIQRTISSSQSPLIHDSTESSSKSTELDLSQLSTRITDLQKLLERMKGSSSWTAIARAIVDSIPSMKPSTLAKLNERTEKLFAKLDKTYTQNPFFGDSYAKLMKQFKEVLKVAGDLQTEYARRPTATSSDLNTSAQQAAVNKIAAFLATVAATDDPQSTASATTNFLGSAARRIVRDTERTKLMEACQNSLKSLQSQESTLLEQLIGAASTLTNHLQNIPRYKNLMCQLPNLSLQESYDKITYELNDFGGNEFQQMLLRRGRQPVAKPESHCNTLLDSAFKTYDSLFVAADELNSPSSPDELSACLKGSTLKGAKTLDRYIDLGVEASSLLQDSALLSDLQRLSPALKEGITLLESNAPNYAEFATHIKSHSELNRFLSNNGVDALSRAALLNSLVDINVISKLRNGAELQSIFCNGRSLQRVFNFSSEYGSLNINDLVKGLCKDDTVFANAFLEHLNLAALRESCNHKRSQQRSDSWLNQLMSRGNDLFSKLASVAQFSRELDAQGSASNARLTPKAEPTSIADATADAVYRIYTDKKVVKAQEILGDLSGSVFNAFGNGAFGADFEQLLNGVSGLSKLKERAKGLLEQSYPLQQIFASNEYFRRLFGSALNASDAEITLSNLVKATKRNYQDVVCDPSELAGILQATDIDFVKMSKELCHRTQANIQTKNRTGDEPNTSRLLADISYPEIARRYIFTSLASKFDCQPSGTVPRNTRQVPDVLRSVESIADALPFVMKSLRSSRSAPKDSVPLIQTRQRDWAAEIRPVARSNLQVPSLESIGRIFCGKRLSFLGKAINVKSLGIVSSSSINSDSATSGKRRLKQTEELNHIPSDFCRNIYHSILDLPFGTVLWEQVQPLLRGKILVAPDVEAVRYIINEANTTFSDLKGWFDLAKTARNMSQALKQISGNPKDLNTVQAALQMPAVKMALRELVGLDANRLLDSISNVGTLTMDEMLQVQQMSDVITALSECISFDRFVFFGDEASLELVASSLSAKGSLLAAIVFADDITFAQQGRRARNSYVDRGRNNSESESVANALPRFIKYKIRMNADVVPRTDELVDRLWGGSPSSAFYSSLKYYRGFAQLQDMIDTAIVKLQVFAQSGNIPNVSPLELKQMPVPCFEKDMFLLHLKYWLAMFMIAAWLLSTGFLIKAYVCECENGLTQMMRVMGLRSGIRWLSWFITSFATMFLIALLILMVLKFGLITPLSSWSLLLAIMVNFIVSVIMLSYLISVFFTKTTLAALTGIIVYLMSYVPFIVINMSSSLRVPYWSMILSSLSAPTAFSFACTYIAMYEEAGIGISWENFHQKSLPGYEMSCSMACWMMFIDSIVYGLIAFYFSNVLPRSGEKRADWSVFVKRNYRLIGSISQAARCTLTSIRHTSSIYRTGGTDTATSPSCIISEADQKLMLTRPVGIALQHLTKRFANSERSAVENLRLNFYEGHVTALLGTNGAGKTTTINMLTGISKPSSGCAIIYGHDTNTEFEKVQNIIGFCPQYNILFEHLTVREHLEFYGALKGAHTSTELKIEVERMLRDTDLWQKQSTIAEHLSGGMKRRLCVAIAFIAGSKTVILDEPTAGIDPVARRNIWDIINRHKQDLHLAHLGRTILLCTHHLDEADLLSDRVAVLHQGNLLCSGSPTFLKTRFGSGYHLALTVKPGVQKTAKTPLDETASRLQEYLENRHQAASPGDSTLDKIPGDNDLLLFVKQYVPDATTLEQSGSEILIALPTAIDASTAEDNSQAPASSSAAGSMFGTVDVSPNGCVSDSIDRSIEAIQRQYRICNLLKALEESKAELGIEGFGISDCTLEEVFLNVCRIAEFGQNIPADMAALPATRRGRGSITSVHSSSTFADYELPGGSKSGSKEIIFGRNERRTGCLLKLQQFWALLLKRFHHTRRDWRILISGILLPCLFVAMAMAFSTIRPEVTNYPPLLLHPETYGPNSATFFADGFGKYGGLQRTFLNATLGTYCVQEIDDGSCYQQEPFFASNYVPILSKSKYNGVLKQCKCELGQQKCPIGAEGVVTPRLETRTKNYVYDLSEAASLFGLQDYLLQSHYRFSQERLGGLSYLVDSSDRHVLATYTKMFEAPLKVWFSNKGSHTMPALINAASNVRLLSAIRQPSLDYGIMTYSHPFKFSQEQLKRESLMQRIADVGIAIVFLCAYSFIPAGLIIYSVQERVSKEKQLQYLSGIGPLLYWSVSFLWDFIVYLLAVVLGVVIMCVCRISIYTVGSNLAATAVLLLLYGWSCIPLMYLLQRLFQDASVAYIVLFCASVFIGINTMVAVMLLNMLQWLKNLASAYEVMKYLSLIFPQYCLGGGLVELAKNHIQAELLENLGEFNFYKFPLSYDVLGYHYWALFITGIAFFLLNVLIECRLFCRCRNIYRSSADVDQVMLEDDDVCKERQRVMQNQVTARTADVLELVNISKEYVSVMGKNKAVNNLYLGVPKGECFGLLGTNGAGKTTTFQMLTGGLVPSTGDVFVDSKSTTRSLLPPLHEIGYCPQEDASDELLTGLEVLRCHARLRGYYGTYLEKVVHIAVARLELESDAQHLVKTYSGGTKRKLATAIALLGRPKLILLDEPTSGMDPATRRLVWNNITNAVRDGRSVVLTSHSMDECDTLCTRLAIMVNGQFRCLGSPQHLKQKFGRGYTVKVRIKCNKSISYLLHYVEETFVNVIIKDTHATSLEFVIPSNNSSTVLQIFDCFEQDREKLGLIDYSVTQTTLDQVFIDFAKQQSDGITDMMQATNLLSGVSCMSTAGMIEGSFAASRPQSICLSNNSDHSSASSSRGLAYHRPILYCPESGFGPNPVTDTLSSRSYCQSDEDAATRI